MKNTFNVRKIATAVLKLEQKYLALGLAFVICLLMVAGLRASAVGPSVAPPGGDVAPNFSGLTVNGLTTLDSVDAQGPIKNTLGNPVLIGTDLSVEGFSTFKGNMDLQGTIKNTLGNPVLFGTNVKVDGDLEVTGEIIGLDIPEFGNEFDDLIVNNSLDLKGALKNTSGNLAGYIEVADKMAFSSLTEVKADGNATLRLGTDDIWMGLDNNEISVYKNMLYLQTDSDTDVQIGGGSNPNGLRVYGKIYPQGGIETLDSGTQVPIEISDSKGMKFTGSNDVKPDGNALIHLGNGTAWMGIDNNEIGTYGGQLYLQNDSDQNVQIGNSTHNSNLQVYGDLKAKHIGKYTKNASSTYKKILNNGDEQHTASCPAGSIALSCGFVPFTNQSGSEYQGADFFVTGMSVKMDEGACAGHFVNKTGSTKYVKVYAVCFNPNSN